MATKKEDQSGTQLIVNGLDVINDPAKSRNATELQVVKGQLYFSKRNQDIIKQSLFDMASDSRISPSEKTGLKKQWDRIQLDHSLIVFEAGEWKLTGTQEYANYLAAYTSLSVYLSPLLADFENTSIIDPAIYKTKFDDYFSAYEALYTKQLTTQTKVEIYEGYDLTHDGSVIATTTPTEPVVLASSTKRDIYLTWTRQPNLTGADIRYEVQVLDTPFGSVDPATAYSIGPGGDQSDSWQGTAGLVTVVYGTSLSIANFPMTWTGGGPGARTFYFRVRCRQSTTKVSPWGTVSVVVKPITAADISKDTVTEQISNIKDLVTIGENGFMGANYDLTDEAHLFTTNDRRVFIDSDEMTFQKVTAVSPENVPTWSDVLKIGGAQRGIVLKELGQRIGLDLDGLNEFSIAFAKALTDYSAYPARSPDGRYLDLSPDGAVGISNSDTKEMVGYFDPYEKKLAWGGSAQIGDTDDIGNSLPEILPPAYAGTPGYSNLITVGPLNGCKRSYLGIEGNNPAPGSPELGTMNDELYFEISFPNWSDVNLLGITANVPFRDKTFSEAVANWFYCGDSNYIIYDRKDLNQEFYISGGADIQHRNPYHIYRVNYSLKLKSSGLEFKYSHQFGSIFPPASDFGYANKLGIHRICLSTSQLIKVIESGGNYYFDQSLMIMAYVIDPDGLVFGHSEPLEIGLGDMSNRDPVADGYSWTYDFTSSANDFDGSVASYISPLFIENKYSVISSAVQHVGYRYLKTAENETTRYIHPMILPIGFKKLYFSELGHSDNWFLPPPGGKTILGNVQGISAPTKLVGVTGPKGEKGEKGDIGVTGPTGPAGFASVPWNEFDLFKKDRAVIYNTISYIAQRDNSGKIPPDNPDDWLPKDFYSKPDIDTFLLAKSDVTHNHDGAYYTKTEVDLAYYTKTQVDTLIADEAISKTTDDTFLGQLSVGSTDKRTAGIYGLYDPYKTAHLWSIGPAYKISDTGDNFGNLYGMAYKHTYNPTGGDMAGGHQIVFCANGTPYVAIGLGGGIWTTGNVHIGGNLTVAGRIQARAMGLGLSWHNEYAYIISAHLYPMMADGETLPADGGVNGGNQEIKFCKREGTRVDFYYVRRDTEGRYNDFLYIHGTSAERMTVMV